MKKNNDPAAPIAMVITQEDIRRAKIAGDDDWAASKLDIYAARIERGIARIERGISEEE